MMEEHKYPYIPKAYYAAVMFACKIIRESGYKNQAIKRAARYYGVDEDELRKHLDARIAAGAKKRTVSTKGRKYKYFVIGVFYGNDAQGESEFPGKVTVLKGMSEKTVQSRLTDADFEYSKRNDTGSAYSLYRYSKVLSEHNTEQEALEAAEKVRKDGNL